MAVSYKRTKNSVNYGSFVVSHIIKLILSDFKTNEKIRSMAESILSSFTSFLIAA